jgi:hypothetical protein
MSVEIARDFIVGVIYASLETCNQLKRHLVLSSGRGPDIRKTVLSRAGESYSVCLKARYCDIHFQLMLFSSVYTASNFSVLTQAGF